MKGHTQSGPVNARHILICETPHIIKPYTSKNIIYAGAYFHIWFMHIPSGILVGENQKRQLPVV